MQIKLESKRTNKLDRKTILKICKLKNIHWKFGCSNQIQWFNENIKKDDIHNLCFLKKNLIGYTALRQGYYFVEKKKKKKFLLFDTLIINPKYQKKKLGNLLMKFNNLIILKEKKPSFLVCKNRLVKFYRLNNWKVIARQKYKTLYKSFNLKGMTFHFSEKIEKKIYFDVSK